jgi:hypothetical protein
MLQWAEVEVAVLVMDIQTTDQVHLKEVQVAQVVVEVLVVEMLMVLVDREQ